MNYSKITPLILGFTLGACGLEGRGAEETFITNQAWTSQKYDEAKSLGSMSAGQFDDLAGTATYNGTIGFFAGNAENSATVIGDTMFLVNFDTNDLDDTTVSGLVGYDENDTYALYSGVVELLLVGSIDRTFTIQTSASITGNGDTIEFSNAANTIQINGLNADILRTGGSGSHPATINGEIATVTSPGFVLERQ